MLVINALITFIEAERPNLDFEDRKALQEYLLKGLCFGESQLWALYALENKETLLSDIVSAILEWQYEVTTEGIYLFRPHKTVLNQLNNTNITYRINEKKRLIQTRGSNQHDKSAMSLKNLLRFYTNVLALQASLPPDFQSLPSLTHPQLKQKKYTAQKIDKKERVEKKKKNSLNLKKSFR